MSASNQEVPDFSKYHVTDTAESRKSVDDMADTIKSKLGVAEVDLSGIKNTEVLEPFIKQFEKIQKDTGMKFPDILASEIIDGDVCCIAGFKPMENKLYISSKFFNSKQALEDTMKDWASKGILPKQAKSIRYLAEHEAAHIRIPNDLFKSKDAQKIHKKRKLENENDVVIYEYYADVVAIYRTGNQLDTNMVMAIEYLKRKGIYL